jgi:NAD-dependent dihydropyrimidine dehydrogenase PreA subunit
MKNMPPVIDKQLCNLCGLCYLYCPEDVFGPIKNEQPPTVDHPRECWYCAVCVMECPVAAVDLEWLPQFHMVPHVPTKYGLPQPGEEELVKATAALRSVIKD